MAKFLGNVEWGKYRVVKWVWPWCVYGSLLRFTTSISYDSSASALSPVRKQIPPSLFSAYGPRHKQMYPPKKGTPIEKLWLLWCRIIWAREAAVGRVGVYGGVSVFIWCLHSAGVDVGSVQDRCGASRDHVNRHAPVPPFKRQKEEKEEEAEVVRRGVKKSSQCLVKACSLTQSLSLSASQGAR